ncbi:major facilitator superfamily MFS_1 [Delftia acidovorans SPH-1]|jgi:MFS family permease|uniref:Major facilitator superfamily MFS_1 n=4 Tax=Pseudomonadati TaxID=3379134 RepID=A9BPL7_DELAS|nr:MULTISPECIES: MFS transporter [Delftia]MBA4001865.1 MFS transporter [Delftia sp.]OLE94510.1 MAG: MFS transporter [Delftia sp. 13_1_40CM_3_66_6]ABX32884.1 major facilitator superfamily MFS_1 [Delftia acidovorans SPH-1]AEF87280.1 General substrate transporter [Delftia sp. Cs1-4]EZP52003.1 Major facilitator superfamily MFS_1 [Delftia sp. RIT313]
MDPALTKQTVSTRNIVAAVIGNALEWYDFLVFAFMTPIVAKLFFPSNPDNPDDNINRILMTTAVFGVGFFMRPVGGILLGLYGDRKGRKAAMVMVTGLMAVAIALITLAPTYAAVGILAPLFIVLARLLQGFAAGGEFGTSTALLIELAPPGKRGFYGSWQMAGQMLALLIGAATGTLITEIFTEEELMAWAWRVPFAVGLLIVPVALYIRRHVEEPEVFKEMQAAQASGKARQIGIMEMLRTHARETLVGMGLVVTATVSIYITFTYLVTYATVTLKLPMRDAFMVQMAGAALMVVIMPFFGALSDRVGRRMLTIGSLIGYLVVLYPLYAWLTDGPTVQKLLITQLVVCVFVAVFFGVFSTVMAELFPPQVRSAGMSMAYNVAVMIFGGFAQFIVTWLIRSTGSPMAPAFYVMFGVTLGLFAAFFIKDRAMERNLR